MHTQTLYTYALVAFASSVLAAPVGTSGLLKPTSTSVSKNLVAREPFVVYGKSFEEDSGASFEKERRVDGFALPVSKTTVISRGNEGASGSPPNGQSSGSNNGNGNGNGNGNENGNRPPPGPPPSSNGPGNSGPGNSGSNGNGSSGPSSGPGNNGPSSGGPSGGSNEPSNGNGSSGPSNGGPSGGPGGNQH
ncbi:hypothetical protein BCON_0011g00190 [Botryotinia convoluta]|uniref:Uncharacterized protein n=1 Tax=Botryotinia convoluta TaxID=54673 RepID=A0A4Z1IQ43_9HELO|nr:hypothetical protein BCON_0011g00190 [Botryotinia convoluta]